MTSRQKQPPIDGFQFMVHPDPDSASDLNEDLASATTTTTTSDSRSSLASQSRLLVGGARFDAVDYLVKSLYSSLESVELDRTLVQQSQMSGQLNNSAKEILATIDALEKSLKAHIARYEKLRGNIVPEIVANLDASARLARKIEDRMKKYYPIEYSKSKDKVLNRITDEDDDLYI